MVSSGGRVVASLPREDWLRIHSLLACFESPYRSGGEVVERSLDEAVHERLRRRIALLLQE